MIKEKFVPVLRPWIVCAAIKRKSDGLVLAGARHFDSVMRSIIREGSPYGELDRAWADADQGFIDQFGRFYTRDDAAKIAVSNGQCAPDINHLFSEDLY